MSQQTDTNNRRQHPRVPANLLPTLTARLSGGASVRLLDVSRRGVRLETPLHMRPGQTVAIRFVAADATVTLSAAVVRATVARVDAEGIKYETALSLAGDLVLCDQLTEAAMQEAEPAEAPAGAGTAAPPPASLAPVVDYTVIVRGVPDAPSLLEGLQANSW
ncbi:MAG: PilZ domain-containing protein [Acidobacteria bacterium]|nr:PilZ domain-containing protein [Acidobacteriota bacterium]